MGENTPIRLRLPRQDLREFGQFEPTAAGAERWAANLPVADTTASAGQLQEALSQLNRVELRPEERYAILEALRPRLQLALSGLAKRYLNQPLVMPEEPRRCAGVADTLNAAAGTGYAIVAIHAIQRRDSISALNPARLACQSLHRAVRCAGARLLQTFQLYRPVPPHGWLTLHQLYVLAEAQELAGRTVADELAGDSDIATAYLQALLLGCCKPNQLRQGELASIYGALAQWCSLLQVGRDAGELVVELDNDQPPLYTAFYQSEPGPRTRYIATGPLVDHLQWLRAGGEAATAGEPRLAANLLEHLADALGSASVRNFARRSSHRPLWVTIGLSSSHFHLAGERSLERVLYGDDYLPPPAERLPRNPFLASTHAVDQWQRANPEEDFSGPGSEEAHSALAHQVEVDGETLAALEGLDLDEEPTLRQRHPVFRVSTMDISPGGYCFEWPASLPGDIRTGDLVSLRESDGTGWSVAVVRWMNRPEEQRSLIGLELLAPGAMPYGARLHQRQKDGEEAPVLRVLLLPEIRMVGQPATLVTPRAGFRERQKIILLRHGEQHFVQLLRQLRATGSFAQFEFRFIKQVGDVLAQDRSAPGADAFDSLWNNI